MPNNRFQGTLHKVSGPLTPDVGMIAMSHVGTSRKKYTRGYSKTSRNLRIADEVGREFRTSALISRRSGPLRSPSYAPSYCDLQPIRLALFDRHLSSELTPEKLHSNNPSHRTSAKPWLQSVMVHCAASVLWTLGSV